MGHLNPVPLARLAEYLRDGELVDMRVLHDDEMVTLERVLIREMIVRRDDEALTAQQEFVDNGTTLTHDLVIECDNIMWARPTSFELHTVNPVKTLEPEPESLEDTGGVMERAWEAVANEHGVQVTVDQFRDSVLAGGVPIGATSAQSAIDIKHLVVLAAWHTSDMAPDRICKLVGYSSQQPFLTATHKCHLNVWEAGQIKAGNKDYKYRQTQVTNWRKALKRCVERCLAAGSQLRSEHRRTDSWAVA